MKPSWPAGVDVDAVIAAGRALLQGGGTLDATTYQNLVNALLNGDTNTASNLIRDSTQRGDVGAVATAIATAAATVRQQPCTQRPMQGSHLLLRLALHIPLSILLAYRVDKVSAKQEARPMQEVPNEYWCLACLLMVGTISSIQHVHAVRWNCL